MRLSHIFLTWNYLSYERTTHDDRPLPPPLTTCSSGGADAGAMQSLRDDLAEAKSTIKSKEKDASEAVNKSKDLEKKVG